MNAQTDQQLLRDYAGSRSEAAFAELVRRHIDLVYSAALRMVCDSHQAEDVTQGVFVALAENARQLTHHPVLSGWLHRTTQNLAANAVRTNVRRQTREQEAAAMNELLAAGSDVSWEHIAPHLDAALGELSEPDRDAVLLRYFEKKSAQEMAERLGISDEAAQKRVTRAVERLREFFAKRGVTVGASGLVVVISANAVQAAPVGLAVTISVAATLTGITLSTTATATATKTIAMTTLQKTLITATITAAIGMAVYAFYLGREIRLLRHQQSVLVDQVEQLTLNREELMTQIASSQKENEQLRREANDILRLRAEVARLRQQQKVPQQITKAETNSPSNVEEVQIQTTAKFVSMPTEDLKTLGVAWTPSAQGGKSGILTDEQFKVLNEAMQGASDVNIMGAPRTITLNGGQATVSMSRAVPLAGTNANVGVSLNVTSCFSTNSSTFDLHLIAQLTQLVGDSSQFDVRTTQATNRATLFPGQILVLQKEIPSGGWLPDFTNSPAAQRSLLVFVTPKVVNARDLHDLELDRVVPSPR